MWKNAKADMIPLLFSAVRSPLPPTPDWPWKKLNTLAGYTLVAVPYTSERVRVGSPPVTQQGTSILLPALIGIHNCPFGHSSACGARETGRVLQIC